MSKNSFCRVKTKDLYNLWFFKVLLLKVQWKGKLLEDKKLWQEFLETIFYKNRPCQNSLCWPLILRGGHGCGLDVLPLHFLTLTLAGHASKLMAGPEPHSVLKIRLEMGLKRPKLHCFAWMQKASPNGKLRNGPKRMRSTREDGALPLTLRAEAEPE